MSHPPHSVRDKDRCHKNFSGFFPFILFRFCCPSIRDHLHDHPLGLSLYNTNYSVECGGGGGDIEFVMTKLDLFPPEGGASSSRSLTSAPFDVTSGFRAHFKMTTPKHERSNALKCFGSFHGKSPQAQAATRLRHQRRNEQSGARTLSAARCTNVVHWCYVMRKVLEGGDFPVEELITFWRLKLFLSASSQTDGRHWLLEPTRLPRLNVIQSHGDLIIMSRAPRS